MLAKQLLTVCLAAMVVVGIGCTPKLVGTDAAVYETVPGQLYASSGKDIDAVYQASLAAMDKLQLKVTDKAKDAFGAKVTAQSSDDKTIVITIKSDEDKTTKYTIRAGGEERARKIYAEINNSFVKSK
jgi:hypothetical protein